MLKLPAVVTREIDGFLPAADAVKRGLVAKESPEPVGTVGQPLGGELIMQTGNGAEFTKSESEEVSFVELLFNRKLSAGEINHFLYKPVAAKLPPKPPANIGDLVMGPKGRAFVRSIDVENQTMSLKAVMGSGTTRKTPWAQVSGKIAV